MTFFVTTFFDGDCYLAVLVRRARTIAFIALPFLLQGAYGFSFLLYATPFTPWRLAIAVTAPIASHLANRYSAALMSTCGLLLLTLDLVLLACLGAHATVPDILWRAFVFGLVFFKSPNNHEMLSTLPRSRSDTAPPDSSRLPLPSGQSLDTALMATTRIIQAGADTVQLDTSAVHFSL